MLLVVLVHLDTYQFHDLLPSSFFQSFRMPLFFFISGFISYKHQIWNTKFYLNQCKNKIRIQIIPTLFFGLIYTHFIIHKNFSAFIVVNEKYGYWFTICLLEIFLIYYTINYITFKLKKENNDILWTFLIITTTCILYLLRFPFIYNDILYKIGNITTLHNTFYHFPHFIFGVFVAKYFSFFIYLIKNKYIMGAIITLFALLYSFKENLISTNNIIQTFSTIIIAFLGIIIIFAYFRKNQKYLSSSYFIGYTLQYIGRRTLDIYLLHYFFLPYIPHLNNYIQETDPNLFIDFLSFILAFIIIGCCLITSNIIRLSDFLGYWLFGVKKKENIKQ